MTTYDGYGDGWVVDSTDPRLSVLWPGVADYDSTVSTDGLLFVLNVAKIQCESFAPAYEGNAPENYVAAQVLQAKALVRAGVTGTDDQVGYQGVTVFPMDWTVKALLRPRRAVPYFGESA